MTEESLSPRFVPPPGLTRPSGNINKIFQNVMNSSPLINNELSPERSSLLQYRHYEDLVGHDRSGTASASEMEGGLYPSTLEDITPPDSRRNSPEESSHSQLPSFIVSVLNELEEEGFDTPSNYETPRQRSIIHSDVMNVYTSEASPSLSISHRSSQDEGHHLTPQKGSTPQRMSHIDLYPRITYSSLYPGLSQSPPGSQPMSPIQPTNENGASVGAAKHMSIDSAGASAKGERLNMEDRYLIQDGVDLFSNLTRYSFFGVFDGHNGDKAASFACEHLFKVLIGKLGNDQDPNSALTQAYLETDKQFLEPDKKFLDLESETGDKSGTTAVTILLDHKSRTLYCGNCGDSRAVLCRTDGVVVPLTSDHKPTLERLDEFTRIVRSGGKIEQSKRSKTFYVAGRDDKKGRVSVTRAIGDADFPHVIAYPELCTLWLSPEDDYDFILLASDGLFDVMTNEEACAFIRNELTLGREPQEISNSLVTKAISELRSGDNVTVIIVKLPTKRTRTTGVTYLRPEPTWIDSYNKPWEKQTTDPELLRQLEELQGKFVESFKRNPELEARVTSKMIELKKLEKLDINKVVSRVNEDPELKQSFVFGLLLDYAKKRHSAIPETANFNELEFCKVLFGVDYEDFSLGENGDRDESKFGFEEATTNGFVADDQTNLNHMYFVNAILAQAPKILKEVAASLSNDDNDSATALALLLLMSHV